MSDHLTIAERLGEVAGRMRSPLAHDLSGAMTPLGAEASAELDALLRELPLIQATTAHDALALTTIARELLDVLAANVTEKNSLAILAGVTLAQAMNSLSACLSGLSGRTPDDFRVVPAPPATPPN